VSDKLGGSPLEGIIIQLLPTRQLWTQRSCTAILMPCDDGKIQYRERNTNQDSSAPRGQGVSNKRGRRYSQFCIVIETGSDYVVDRPHPMHISSCQTCLCNREDGCALVIRNRNLKKGQAVKTVLRRLCCLRVIIFS